MKDSGTNIHAIWGCPGVDFLRGLGEVMASVREWLEGLGLGQFADAFEAEQMSARPP